MLGKGIVWLFYNMNSDNPYCKKKRQWKLDVIIVVQKAEWFLYRKSIVMQVCANKLHGELMDIWWKSTQYQHWKIWFLSCDTLQCEYWLNKQHRYVTKISGILGRKATIDGWHSPAVNLSTSCTPKNSQQPASSVMSQTAVYLTHLSWIAYTYVSNLRVARTQ